MKHTLYKLLYYIEKGDDIHIQRNKSYTETITQLLKENSYLRLISLHTGFIQNFNHNNINNNVNRIRSPVHHNNYKREAFRELAREINLNYDDNGNLFSKYMNDIHLLNKTVKKDSRQSSANKSGVPISNHKGNNDFHNGNIQTIKQPKITLHYIRKHQT